MYNRENALHKWLAHEFPSTSFRLTPLVGDASFRRYFRLYSNERSYILMDAPPEKETLDSFLSVGAHLVQAGIKAPQIFAVNQREGFLLLEDFGDRLLLNGLSAETVKPLYEDAIQTLLAMQAIPRSVTDTLPLFDKAFMLTELNLFSEWFVEGYLKLNCSIKDKQLIESTFDWLTNQLVQQPQVFIHRDYHSRNIMLLNSNEQPTQFGIIDFQDAMYGPFTYDLVSLLKDCYISWPREQVLDYLAVFYQQTRLASEYSWPEFIEAFDLCGLQRHLKVLGVFSRLYLRDKKSNYLKDLPLVFYYVMNCLQSYEVLAPFYEFMQNTIRLPELSL